MINRNKWKIGDIVIHDFDEKTPLFLMIIVESVPKSHLFKTKYINLEKCGPFLNHNDFILDPALFGIDVPQHQRSRHKKVKCMKTLEDYGD